MSIKATELHPFIAFANRLPVDIRHNQVKGGGATKEFVFDELPGDQYDVPLRISMFRQMVRSAPAGRVVSWMCASKNGYVAIELH